MTPVNSDSSKDAGFAVEFTKFTKFTGYEGV